MSLFSIFNKNKNQVKINISGLHCQHCVMKAKNALEALDNVKKADVKLNETSVITLKEPATDYSDILSALTEVGYSGEIVSE